MAAAPPPPPAASGRFVIKDLEFELYANDPGTGTQQGYLILTFDYGGKKGLVARYSISHFTLVEKDDFLGRFPSIHLMHFINAALEERGVEERPAPEEVWKELEPRLPALNRELEALIRDYDSEMKELYADSDEG